MRIATAASTLVDSHEAIDAVVGALIHKLGGEPDYLLVFYTETHDPEVLGTYFSEKVGRTQIQGCSSCQFVMTEEGIHGENGRALGAWAIRDADGAYGVGMAPLNGEPEAAAAEALEEAMKNSGRPGEVPALVWLTATPGCEERVIAGIENVLGNKVPIFGGSAADNSIDGNWSLICNNRTIDNGIVLAIFYPSGNIAGFFHNGYSPSANAGTVSRAAGRAILEIDGRPAAAVYDEWTGGLLGDDLENGGNVLNRTTLAPLGRVAGTVRDVTFYNLSHPVSVTGDGGLTLFTDIAEGDRIVCMSGARDSLITRAGRVAKLAADMRSNQTFEVQGALVIYCAGCMLTVGEGMNEVVDSVREALGDVPFIGGFTFGEQGCFLGGRNDHGNLMISVVGFSS